MSLLIHHCHSQIRVHVLIILPCWKIFTSYLLVDLLFPWIMEHIISPSLCMPTKVIDVLLPWNLSQAMVVGSHIISWRMLVAFVHYWIKCVHLQYFYEVCVMEKMLQKVMCNISHISGADRKTLVQDRGRISNERFAAGRKTTTETSCYSWREIVQHWCSDGSKCQQIVVHLLAFQFQVSKASPCLTMKTIKPWPT